MGWCEFCKVEGSCRREVIRDWVRAIELALCDRVRVMMESESPKGQT